MLGQVFACWAWVEHAVVALVLLALVEAWARGGRGALLAALVGALRSFRLVRMLLDALLRREVAAFTRQIKEPRGGAAGGRGERPPPVKALPKQGWQCLRWVQVVG